jgi:hypothetical protein
MKAMVGPATMLSEDCWTTLASSGWELEVMKIATGPLMPAGTTHCWSGKGMESAIPPASIWQNKLFSETVPLRAVELKVRRVPGWTEPVFVIANDGLGVTPTSHPEMKELAMART